MALVVLKSYGGFNQRRYGNPWVGEVMANARISFEYRIGGYTGGYNKGEAGDLYIEDPKVDCIYAYGQKDHRGRHSECEYAIYKGDGKFEEIVKTELIGFINDSPYYKTIASC